MIEASEGEVVYVQFAVLAEAAELRRFEQETPDEATSYARAGTYLGCARHNGTGDFQLKYARDIELDADDEILDQEDGGWKEVGTVIAHRGLDFVLSSHNDQKDISFRENIDLMVDGSIRVRASGLGDWRIHGWIGPRAAIPRARA